MSHRAVGDDGAPAPRRPSRRTTRRPSRRTFLAGVAGVAAGALAGCVADGSRGSAPDRERAGSVGDTGGRGPAPVSILAAGSLQLALSRGLASAVDVPLRIEARGSTALARLIAAGVRDPDIVSVADTALFHSILDPSWYAVFASNAIVVAYNRDTPGGRRVGAAGRDAWYEPLRSGAATLGRTDPDADPLGYRTLFVLELAARYYHDAAGLSSRLPARSPVYPETSLLSRFETGAVDAAVVYRNMAEERGYDYVPLPDEIDLGSPEHAEDWYSTASYRLPDGTTVRGDVIAYGSTARHLRPETEAVFSAHVTGSYLEDHGFLVPDDYPRFEGDVPDAIGD